MQIKSTVLKGGEGKEGCALFSLRVSRGYIC
jgi:hypothetical protein